MFKTSFHIAQMDCPSEEQMIRLKLAEVEGIQALEFDLDKRNLKVIHRGKVMAIQQKLEEIKLPGKLIDSVELAFNEPVQQHEFHRKLLWAVLLINFAFFAIEMTAGLFSNSMGLVADSLDMLADSLVYGLALMAVGSSLLFKKKVAKTAGVLQLVLAMLGFAEIVRRFFFAKALPDFSTMVIVSVLALLANTASLYLLQKSKSSEAHMRAGMIFTSNDIIINAGVIVAALLVKLSSSALPDLLVGAVVFAIVIKGAFKIFRLGT